jgi:hypothetical protein
MKISRQQLRQAANDGILSTDQAETLFMNLGWEKFGGWGILAISVAHAVIGLMLATRFEYAGHLIPAGICATFVIAITSLAIYGLQQGMGL